MVDFGWRDGDFFRDGLFWEHFAGYTALIIDWAMMDLNQFPFQKVGKKRYLDKEYGIDLLNI